MITRDDACDACQAVHHTAGTDGRGLAVEAGVGLGLGGAFLLGVALVLILGPGLLGRAGQLGARWCTGGVFVLGLCGGGGSGRHGVVVASSAVGPSALLRRTVPGACYAGLCTSSGLSRAVDDVGRSVVLLVVNNGHCGVEQSLTS